VTDRTAFGKRLSACRRSAGLSQQELADRSALSVRAVSDLERGRTTRPHPDTVRRLADALGLRELARAQFIEAAARRLGPAAAAIAAAPDESLFPVSSGHVVPRQMPAPVAQFAGRRAELTVLSGLLGPAGSPMPAAAVICTIGGTAGVGKTALAVHWAHQAASRFPDGQLYVNLLGFHPSEKTPMSQATAIRCLLEALEIPPERVPASLDAQAELYRSLMAGRRMLLVLDNARDAEQVRPLLPGSPGCLVLVTSRSQLPGLVALEGARQLTLDLLPEAEAYELLIRRLGAPRLAAAPGAVAELVGLCAGLPLALAISAAHMLFDPQLDLSAFTRKFTDARGTLDALDTGDATASVRAVFSWSLGSVSAPTARLFGLLGLHPGPDITMPAAASLAGVPPAEAWQALNELTRAHLVTEHVPGRFAMHDLLRAYAAEQATAVDPAERRTALHRMFDHYLQTSHSANQILYPGREPLRLPTPQAGTVPGTFTDARQALAWLRAERTILLASMAQATESSFDTHAWQIAYYLAMFLNLHGYWAECADSQRAALASARRLGDTVAQARIHLISSHACLKLGRGHDALDHLRNALGLYRQLMDPVGQARIHVAFSLVLNQQRKHSDAFGHAQQALVLYWSAGHRAGLAQALNAVGWSEAHLAHPERAIACCGRAISLHRELGNKLGEAESWDSLGYAHHQLGDYDQAIDSYERAIACHRELGNRHEEASNRTCLGDVHLLSGDHDRARHCWESALAVFEEEHHPSVGAVRRRLQRLDNAAEGGGPSEPNSPAGVLFFEPVS
jgi:tetratricopeptide (TPR) repeat protein/transcriptional regulator with XRE-family HTH domain